MVHQTQGSMEEFAVSEDYDMLATSPLPMGLYVPAVVHNGLVFTAGMTPRKDGVLLFLGRVGDGLDINTAREACALAATNALSAAASALGGLKALTGLVSMTVYIACTPDFTDLSTVADAASERIEELLGSDSRARAARAAIGVQSLPGGAPVEVQLIATSTSKEGTK